MSMQKITKTRIEALDEKYPNAIPVFGGAYFAVEYVQCDNPNINKFVEYLPDLVHSAIFHKWHEGIEGALNRFCNLCFIDPKLVECYLGTTFSEIAKHYTV